MSLVYSAEDLEGKRPPCRVRRRFRPALLWLVGGLIGLGLGIFCAVKFRLFLPPFRIENKPEDVIVSAAARSLPLTGSALVFVVTAPLFHSTRVRAVNVTWLPRVRHGVVFTSEPLDDPNVPFRTIYAGFDDSYWSLFHKTMFGFHYAYTHISDQFDFYVKADDDTYIVAENLQRFLSTLDPEVPIYAGFRLKHHGAHGYNSGGAYVLSRAAVRLFEERLYGNESACPFHEFEDVGMGACLERVGVFPMDTRDAGGGFRFNLDDAWTTLTGSASAKDDYYFDESKPNFAEFSPDLITLHHMSPEELLIADLFLYRVRLSAPSRR
ncbi:hypothetical protein M3Y99_01588200 [Aphelenchoides fujianensis]|nr:hypothetical protein M3Y99_01588200 [Aphelenchoides fujianensis]